VQNVNDELVVQLLTEIRDNQLREIRLREEYLELAKIEVTKRRRGALTILAFTAILIGFLAFMVWHMLRNQKSFEEWREQRQREQLEPVFRAAGEGFYPSTGASLTV
jgi:hypothetical protein